MDWLEGPRVDEPIEYEPIGVKQLLVEMKDSSELIIDLAYSALLHNSRDLASEVLDLESRMDLLQLQARMNLLMAARTTDDARQLAPVLGIVGAAEKISDAAGGIANIVLGEESLPGTIRSALPDAMEVLARAELDEASVYTGRTLGEINLETDTGVRIIAIRGGDGWNLHPDRDTTLSPGDVLLLRGPEARVEAVFETVSGDSYEQPGEADHDIDDLSRAVDTIVLMKNVSELSVDLAYASVLFDDEALAAEVHDLEVEVDGLHSRLEAWTLQAAGALDDPVSLRGLLQLANSTELLSDAALEISEGILRDIDTHPVIAESVRDSEVAVRRLEVEAGSPYEDSTVEALEDAHPGVTTIAIHRTDDEWVFYPDEADRIAVNDALLIRGTWKATEQLLADATAVGL